MMDDDYANSGIPWGTTIGQIKADLRAARAAGDDSPELQIKRGIVELLKMKIDKPHADDDMHIIDFYAMVGDIGRHCEREFGFNIADVYPQRRCRDTLLQGVIDSSTLCDNWYSAVLPGHKVRRIRYNGKQVILDNYRSIERSQPEQKSLFTKLSAQPTINSSV